MPWCLMFSSQYGAHDPDVPVDSGAEEVLVLFALVEYSATVGFLLEGGDA